MFDVEVNYRRADVWRAAALRGVFLLLKARPQWFLFHPKKTPKTLFVHKVFCRRHQKRFGKTGSAEWSEEPEMCP